MPTLEQIRAADRLRGETRFRKTPLHFPASLNARLPGGARVHLKLEILQRTGSFKVRGATARITALDDAARRRGIIAASAGNHAQGVALAAASMGIRARIVMPLTAPLTKQEATAGYGAEVILHGTGYDDAYGHAVALHEAEGGTLVHAFDDDLIMAGQGTIGLEILEDLPDLRAVVCPVGGGGLISGVAVAVKSLRPDVKIIGVQSEGASSAVDSFRAGERLATAGVKTIADGIKVAQVGERCFDVIRRTVDDMVTVSDVDVCRAILLLDEHAHVAAEPAGAAPIAALLSDAVRLPDGDCAVVVSGGNIDTFAKTRFIRRALAEDQRHLRVRVRLQDRRGSKPRQMAALFNVLADQEVNILQIDDRRNTRDLPVGVVEVELLLETRGSLHADAVETALLDAQFELASPVTRRLPPRDAAPRALPSRQFRASS